MNGQAVWALRAGQVHGRDGVWNDGGVVVGGERIERVGPWDQLALPASIAVADVRPWRVAAGFIDLHVHGGGGGDFMDGDDEGFEAACAWHARGGTTALLATTCAAPLESVERALARVRAWRDRPPAGARVLGAHLEGPFLNPRMRGCHPEAHVAPPTPERVERLLRHVDVVRHVTLAPEIAGAQEAVERFARAGVGVALAHTDATSREVDAAIAGGAAHVTHLFNAMSYFHREGPLRVSGMVEAALARDALTVEVIADGLHVNPDRLGLAVRAKGVSRVCLVTDAMRGAGMPDGIYAFGPREEGLDVRVEGGRATTVEGTALASSTASMIRCVQVMARQPGLSLHDVLAMASANPAKVLGLDHRKGAVAAGLDADLVVLDEALDVRLTVVAGRIVSGGIPQARRAVP